jgi:HNH endonuclease
VSPVQAQDQERPRRRRSELERLLDRTILEPAHPELGTCWQFTGTTTPYGRIAKAQDSYTHRLGWKLLRGPIPEDKELHHRCGVHACWNPDHLQMVTHAENLAFKRKTHCKHGHPRSGENLRTNPRTGARVCRGMPSGEPTPAPGNGGRTGERPSSARKTGKSDKSGRPHGGPRSVFERLVNRTVLGGCHPELGTCWVFTGPADPYGRIGKAPSDRLPPGLEAVTRPDTRRHGTSPSVWRPCLLESRPSAARYPRRESGRTGARRTASADTRCQVPTYGSTPGLSHGAAVSAAPNTSERFASARRRPSDQDDCGATEHRR